MRVLAFVFVLASCASAATVETHAVCSSGQPDPFGRQSVSGTYSAHCEDNYWVPSLAISPGYWLKETESASIAPGSKVEVSSYLPSPYVQGSAEATFSAAYVFTLTGGSSLFDFGPMGMGAFATPCLTVVNRVPWAPTRTSASLYAWGLDFPGDLCARSGGGVPVLLNVPTTMQLTLTAYSTANYMSQAWASAEFDGFRFTDNWGNLLDVTYTFTLNDQLPANLPEPGSFAMMATAAALWLILRRRLAA